MSRDGGLRPEPTAAPIVDRSRPHPGGADLEPGQRVRWKKGSRWRYGHLGPQPLADDGSLYVFEEFNGGARALRPTGIELLVKGPRGGRRWVPCTPEGGPPPAGNEQASRGRATTARPLSPSARSAPGLGR